MKIEKLSVSKRDIDSEKHDEIGDENQLDDEPESEDQLFMTDSKKNSPKIDEITEVKTLFITEKVT